MLTTTDYRQLIEIIIINVTNYKQTYNKIQCLESIENTQNIFDNNMLFLFNPN